MAMLGKERLRRVEDRRARAVGLAGFLHSIPCRYILSTAIDNTKRQVMSTHVDKSSPRQRLLSAALQRCSE
jgi:hypothetical protein